MLFLRTGGARFDWIVTLRGIALAAALWGLSVAPAQADAPYTVELQKIPEMDPEVFDTLEASSNLIQLRDKPPASPAGLLLRARSDRDRLAEVLKSYGYFEGTIAITLNDRPLRDVETDFLREKESVAVVLLPAPGPLYKIGKTSLIGPPPLIDGGLALALETGAPATGSSILQAESELLDQLRLLGYPYAEMKGRDLRLDAGAKALDVEATVDPGPQVTLGDLEVNGNEFVESDFIALHKSWQPGTVYDPKILESFRKEISSLGVFSSAKLRIEQKPEDEIIKDGEPVDVLLDVEERKRRFFGFGTDYITTQGLGVNAFWGHRNLFGRGERLKVSARVGRLIENDLDRIDTILSLQFNKPHFLTKDLSLVFDAGLTEEHPDAFDRKAVTLGLGLEHKISRTLALGAGVNTEYAEIVDNNGDREEFFLFGIPVYLRHDTTDDSLDPHRGLRNEIKVTPYFPLLGDSDLFTRAKWVSRGYYEVMEDGGLVLAGRLVLGSIFGEETMNIPSDKRFFSGGGGSVRGYEFQRVGPRDANLDPTGGRSLVEVGLELRFRYKNFGIVPFLDGGNVFDSTLPRFDHDYQWGAGLGIRYYTDFGPIRADFAVPLNRREGDDHFAFYISIGQSF